MKYIIPNISIEKCNRQPVFPPINYRKGWIAIWNDNGVKYEYFKVLQIMKDSYSYLLERKTPSYYWSNYKILEDEGGKA